MFCAIFTVLVRWFILHSSAARGSHQVKSDVLTDRAVKSLENVVDFYKNSFDKVNLDSIYGLRVAQGSLATLLKTLPIDHSLFQKLTSLHDTMTNAAEKALPYLKEYQPDYYYQFKPVVDKPWSIFQDFKKMKNKTTRPSNPELSEHYFDEQISDNCMTEMIGTNAYSKHPCHVSFDCMKLMTSDDLKGYGNTHQILYFLFGYQTGCRTIIEKKFPKFCGFLKKCNILNVDKFLERKCGQILVEMNQLKENVVINGDTDLFMEQGLVCSILGYEDFLDRTILENILLWQDKEYGCFGRKNSHIKEYEDTRHVMRRITMRKILYERELDDGCSSHETGVATGLLSIYLRWLLLHELELKI